MTDIPQTRIILRVHEVWQDDSQMVIRAWFSRCGYPDNYDWANYHGIFLGGVNGGRYHIIIDMGINGGGKHQLTQIPHEIYRFRKKQVENSSPIFELYNPTQQPEVYETVRQYSDEVPWGGAAPG